MPTSHNTLGLLWQQQRLIMLLIPTFLVALSGLVISKVYLTGTDTYIVAILSVLALAIVAPAGLIYYPWQGEKSAHVNLNIDTYEGQPDLYIIFERRISTEALEAFFQCKCGNTFRAIVKGVPKVFCPRCHASDFLGQNGFLNHLLDQRLVYYETGFNLRRPYNFTDILDARGLSLYPDTESCEVVFFRHWGTWEQRVHFHGEMAIIDGFPFWHHTSETLNCRAIKPTEYQITRGEYLLAPCFEIVFSMSRDLDLLSMYQAEIWQLVVELNKQESELLVAR